MALRPTHEQDGQEDRDAGGRAGKQGWCNFGGAAQNGLTDGQSGLAQPDDILLRNNRGIDDQAHGKGQCGQRDDVQAAVE